MTAIILSFSPETSQERADRVLAIWQEQRRKGVSPEHRLDAEDAFERELEVLRQLFSRSK